MKILPVLLSASLGLITGSWSTYAIMKEHQRRDTLANEAAMQYMRGSQLLEMITIADNQSPRDLKVKLNYELARTISFAQAHKNEKGEAGYWFNKILSVSANQRETPIYKVEEAKLLEDLSKPHPIL